MYWTLDRNPKTILRSTCDDVEKENAYPNEEKQVVENVTGHVLKPVWRVTEKIFQIAGRNPELKDSHEALQVCRAGLLGKLKSILK